MIDVPHAGWRRAIVLAIGILLASGSLSEVSAQEIPANPESPTRPTDSRREIRMPLSEAMAIALEHNLDLRVQGLTRENSRRDVIIARAAFDPLFTTTYTMSKFRSPTISFLSGISTSTVSVNPFTNQNLSMGFSGLLPTGTTYRITAGDNRGDNPESGFFAFNPNNNASLEASITQPLLKDFGFGNNLADLRIAANNETISQAQLVRLMETTVAAVQNAYWDLAFAREDLRVKEEGLREATVLLEINQQKVRVGTATQVDVVDAEANIETQKGGIIDAENLIRRTQDTLLDLLNYGQVLRDQGAASPRRNALFEDISVIPTTALAYDEYDVDMEFALQIALENRQDLIESELGLENSKLELVRRENQRLPDLNVTGTWTQQGLDENIGNAVDSLGTFRFYDWSVAITFEYPIGNRQERNRLAQARNNLESSELTLRKTRNTITLEVTQAVRDIRSTLQKVQTTRATTRLRREQLEGETQRLRVGSSTSYQVLQVQNDLLEAQSLELQALVDYKQAITAFESAVGTILSSAGVVLEE